MKRTTLLLNAAVVLLTLLPARALLANDDSDASGQVRVDVVVDMTEAGRKIARPTPDKPAYYLPISVGYKAFGYAHHFQRPPPNEWDIQHALAIALYQQGYQLMSKQRHPSLVLMFWWGYMAPQDLAVGRDEANLAKVGAIPAGAQWGGGSGGPAGEGAGYSLTSQVPATATSSGYTNALPSFSLGVQNLDEKQMLSLVAGNTVDDHQKYPDPRLDEVIQMTSAPRYYILVSAFDFQSWLNHKPVLLWRAHVSTELWGHYLDQVAGALINSAAPFFGRETRAPQFLSAQVTPLARVIVGTPVVKEYPAPPAAEKKP